MERPMLTPEEIRDRFAQEFGFIGQKFAILEGDCTWARETKDTFVAHPGVYVWTHPRRGVVRVGISLQNSRKRALQHVGPDNTGGIMQALGNDSHTRLMLFNVKDPRDSHWACAVEKYFEAALSPEIRPQRLG